MIKMVKMARLSSCQAERGASQHFEHWKPVITLCSVCAEGMKFDFVIKFENLAEEERYLTERLGITPLVKQRWETKNSAGNMTQEVKDKYFNMLSEEEIWQL